MSSIKKIILSNFSIGLVFLLFSFVFYFTELNDYLALFIAIILLFIFFISFRSIIQSRHLHNEYKNRWICLALKIIRIGGILAILVINIFNPTPKSDLYMGIIYIIMGISFLLEAGYWYYLVLHKRDYEH